MATSLEYERSLAQLLLMSAPLAPHLACEMWEQMGLVIGAQPAKEGEFNWVRETEAEEGV